MKEEPKSESVTGGGQKERERTSADAEPFGDEWRAYVMSMSKSLIVEILRSECMKNARDDAEKAR